MTTTLIQIDASGESDVFTATRTVRNSDHENGAIAVGERVFFRRDESAPGVEIVLCYESGEPTNGNQYAAFPSVEAASQFAERAGLARA